MRAILFIVILFGFMGCSDPGKEEKTGISTVDSNTVSTTDTVPALLYLDNPKLDSFPMAMDSAGPTIEPADTQYKKSVDKTATE